MTVKMAPHQLAFWRELLAPFADHELSVVPARGSGKTLTYVDKRALSNRLDSVVGPHGWTVEYEATPRGYKCKLGILCPMETPGTSVWHFKEDGAGFEDMGRKDRDTGEWICDSDNDEKSGYTNAFRRAAQDAFGIGRYLYGKGIPAFLDPNATAPSATPAQDAPRNAQEARGALPAIQQGESPSAPPKELRDRSEAMPSTRDLPKPAPKTQNRGYTLPRPGSGVFAWAKQMQTDFDTSVIDGMSADGTANGWGSNFKAWTEPQVNTICLAVIAHIRELPTYAGQFEHLFPGGVPDPKIVTVNSQKPDAAFVAPGVNVADLRKTLIAKMQELALAQTGVPADKDTLKSIFAIVAPSAENGHGHTGEVPESLAGLTDAVWIQNMTAIVEAQIAAEKEAGETGDADCPF